MRSRRGFVAGEIWRLGVHVRVEGAEFDAALAERVDEDDELADEAAKSQRRRRARNRSRQRTGSDCEDLLALLARLALRPHVSVECHRFVEVKRGESE